MRKRTVFAAGALAALAAGAAWQAVSAEKVPAYVAAAVANPARPQADRDRDAARKPGEVIAFAGVKPGDQVLELIPSGGYFTRILSGVVGPKGHVTEGVPQLTGAPDVKPTSNGIAADPNFKNVTEASMTSTALGNTGPVDLVWTSQNYHDLHLTRLKLDVVAIDKAVFAALKPGGTFFIEDHAAKPGTGTSTTDAEHRIDEDFVKKEVESVGFKLAGESDVLRNPNDDHSLLVFNPAIRGHTDQFLLKFKKPK
jgi:predicted methyltransferase